MSESISKTVYSGIGGQAVMEGVMMKSPSTMATAVRTEKGAITVETTPVKEKNARWKRIPLIRGVVSFADSFMTGMPALMHSAEMSQEAGSEESLSHGEVIGTFLLALVLAAALFMGVPFAVSRLLARWIAHPVLLSLAEGLVRLLLFIGYIVLIGRMEEIRRVFMYHGAEHKCINCIEHGLPLTVDNVRASSRQHKRCGTSFLVFVLLISVFLFMLLRFDSPLLSLVVRILMLPVIAGISYECIRFAGRSDARWVRILSAPGLAVQNLTTREPTDDMIEVGIASVEAAFDWRGFLMTNRDAFGPERAQALEEEMTESLDAPEIPIGFLLRKMERKLSASDVPEASTDARLILSHVSGMSLGALAVSGSNTVPRETALRAWEMTKERCARVPLQYLTAETGFMEYTFETAFGVLIPRPDTEHLVEEARRSLLLRAQETDPHDEIHYLDLCTGSGCVLLSAADWFLRQGTGRNLICAGTDLSEEALRLAGRNAARMALKADLLQADLFPEDDRCWDVITANPPYIPTGVIETLMPEVRDFEPRTALDGGDDGLALLRRMVSKAPMRMKQGGFLLSEIGYDQGAAVRKLFLDEGFREVQVLKDYAGDDRVVCGRYFR